MKPNWILLTFVGAVISLIVAMVLIWYNKKAIAKTLSKRHILHMLRTKVMSGVELANTAKECRSAVILPKLVPVMLVKLHEEGLVQRTGNNMYSITTKGLESLKSLDSIGKEFQKLAKILEKTSTISKFMVIEAIDWISSVKDDTIRNAYTDNSQADSEKSGIPVYDADLGQAEHTGNFERNGE